MHIRLLLVAVKVDEEDVLPDALFARPRFDAGHVDAVAANRLQQFVKQAGAVLRGDEDGGFVAPARFGRVLADDEETGGVVAVVFDVGVAQRHAVAFGRHLSGDGGGGRLGGGKFGRFGIAGDGDGFHFRQVFREPVAALRQRLAVRIDAADAGEGVGVGQEVLADAQQHFAADEKRRGGEAVQRVRHHAFGRVFHRDDAVVAGAAFHRLEHVRDGAHRPCLHRMAELLQHGGLGESAFRAEVGDFQRQFQRQAGGHDFAEEPHRFLIGQRAVV